MSAIIKVTKRKEDSFMADIKYVDADAEGTGVPTKGPLVLRK